MHREDESKYLLYIEPTKEQKSDKPNNDGLSDIMEEIISKAETGISRYSNVDDDGTFIENNAFKGSHVTDCGERSTNKDYLLENGMITNSLAPFYLKWYREVIPETEMIKLNTLLTDLGYK